MDPCSDQQRDSMKDLQWGTELDRLKAHRMETLMDPWSDLWRIASMEQLMEKKMGGTMDNEMEPWMDSEMEDE